MSPLRRYASNAPSLLCVLCIAACSSPGGGERPGSTGGPGGSGSPGGNGAGGANDGPTCAVFYGDANFQGPSLAVPGTDGQAPSLPAAFDNEMSSVEVSPGCTVMAYADANYGGAEVTFTASAGLIPASFNDQMSSYTCRCGGAPSGPPAGAGGNGPGGGPGAVGGPGPVGPAPGGPGAPCTVASNCAQSGPAVGNHGQVCVTPINQCAALCYGNGDCTSNCCVQLTNQPYGACISGGSEPCMGSGAGGSPSSGGGGSGSATGCHSMTGCVQVTTHGTSDCTQGVGYDLNNGCGQPVYCRVCAVTSTGAIDDNECQAFTVNGSNVGQSFCGQYTSAKYECVPTSDSPQCVRNF